MNNKKLFTLLCLLTGIFSAVQAQSWGYGRGGHWVQDIDEATDGSVFAVGLSGEDPLMGYSSSFVVKLDDNGEEIWHNDGTGLAFDYFTGMNVFAMADGGCIVTGAADWATPGAYRLDADGNVVWDTDSWSSGIAYSFLYQGTAAELTDGRIIMGGFVDDLSYHFVEMDNDGNLLSEFSQAAGGVFAFSYYDYKETGITATTDGGFAFSAGYPDYRTITKFNSDLAVEWEQAYEHAADTWEYGQYTNGLTQTSDGGFLLAGSASSDITYTYMGSLRKIDYLGNLEWTTFVNHGSDIEEGAHALELSPGNYMMWTQDAGDNSTHGWKIDSSGVEIGEVFIPIINCSWGFGATGMEIWATEPAAGGGYYIAGRQYMEDCSQRYTVVKSNADGTYPDCIFNCVWPGDADNSGLVDADDLFEIGINYGATGFAREDAGIDWEGKLSRAWMEEDSMYWYIFNDLKYTDCNGDSTINDDDTTAVVNNWGLDHPLNTLRTSTGDVPLYFDPAVTSLSIGLNQIPIYLGDAVNTLDEIYGLAFSVTSSSSNIDAASLRIRFGDSWMAGAEEQLAISKASETETLVSGAMVRTSRTNTSGNGQVATLDVVVIDNLAGKIELDDITLQITNAKAIKIDREEIILDPQSATFSAEVSTPDNLNDLAAGGLSIYPNPVSGNTVQLNGNALSVSLSDATGRLVRSFGAGSNQLDISGIAAGTYTIRVITASGSYTGQLVIH